MKKCSACKVIKTTEEFGKDKSNKDSLQYECRVCAAEKSRRYRLRHPDIIQHQNRVAYNLAKATGSVYYHKEWRSRREYWLKSRYGITFEEYEVLRMAQKDRCAICLTESALDVDHDHASDSIRGLLCRKCNIGLGYFNDDPKLMLAAIDYLKQSKRPDEAPTALNVVVQ